MARLFLTLFLLALTSPAASATEGPAVSPPAAPAEPPVPLSSPTETPPLTLADCFALALKRSETIAIQRELIKETEGRFLQALSGALPRATFEASKEWQDGREGSSFTLSQIPQRKFIFSQPLFSGFKEFAAIQGSRAERRQRQYQRTRAEQLLFTDVADAFHLLLEKQEDRQALETTQTALGERIDDLKTREQLGRSRPSEVVSAEAQLRRVEADFELDRSEETTARQLLEFLTGISPLGPIRDDLSDLPPLGTEEEYVAKAKDRPDVRASEEAWRVAQKEVGVAQGDLWPDINVESNYYTQRVGAAAGVDWDVLLKMDVPLFQGGRAVGALREAASKARQAKLTFERTQRETNLDIREAHAKLQGAIARLAALQRALAAAEENYRLQQEDYRLNLVNNLDVLKTLQELEDARRDVISAHHEAKRLYWKLRVAMGETL